MNDTICAISTPTGIGGVAVIRVSGPEAKKIVSNIIPGEKREKFVPGKFFHTYIIEPETGETLEEAVILYYKAPKSFTGEDVVEITVHGGLYSPQMVIDLLIKYGARIAEPGEFTKRAFLNGKMDLLQVQALLDLVKSRSALQVKYAMSKLQGELSKKLKNVADLLFNTIKEVE
ncbi:MAG: tRNA uridine-5-carboxymethylaminomethyl(34) synthesis GTPase MnmE, partial [bacterium]|nr:tRNA uridine-5-carboxymethylaminomethyl(34) synthesis GTPase MnmE [bacterium]